MWELAFLLLPVAAGSGWLFAKKNTAHKPAQPPQSLGSDYYRGLNYLLNEQPDKALDAFIRMLDVSPDTVETTLALGNFFRRRGEVDKAIRIHQNLIAKPNLTAKQRAQALLELGQDYMRAGVFDRAESLFLELIQTKNEQLEISLRHLIDIYEREKDWEKAIQIAKRLQQVSGVYMGREVAHYHCELAELAWAQGRFRQATKALKSAIVHDRISVRASLLQGDIDKAQGHYKQALKAYKQVQHQDLDFISEVIDKIKACYQKMDAEQALANYLNYLLNTCEHISVVLANAEYHREVTGERQAAQFLANHMRHVPSVRGIRCLIEYHLAQATVAFKDDLYLLRSIIDKLLEHKPLYRCGHCGLATKTLHWQCPSCRQWSSVKPIHRIEGEF